MEQQREVVAIIKKIRKYFACEEDETSFFEPTELHEFSRRIKSTYENFLNEKFIEGIAALLALLESVLQFEVDENDEMHPAKLTVYIIQSMRFNELQFAAEKLLISLFRTPAYKDEILMEIQEAIASSDEADFVETMSSCIEKLEIENSEIQQSAGGVLLPVVTAAPTSRTVNRVHSTSWDLTFLPSSLVESWTFATDTEEVSSVVKLCIWSLLVFHCSI